MIVVLKNQNAKIFNRLKLLLLILILFQFTACDSPLGRKRKADAIESGDTPNVGGSSGAGSGSSSGGTQPTSTSCDVVSLNTISTAQLNTALTSQTVTLQNCLEPINISVAGDGSPQLFKNGNSVSGVVTAYTGDQLKVSLTSSSIQGTTHRAVLRTGTNSTAFVVTTGDFTPNNLVIPPLVNQSLNTSVLSQMVSPSGFDGEIAISVSGAGNPELVINGASVGSSSTVVSGNGLQIRLLTSHIENTTSTVTLNYGGQTTIFQATTTGDATNPWITSLLLPQKITYKQNEQLNFTVNLSEDVFVTGSPRVVLNIGGVTKYANYISGHGSASLLFRYTIESGLNANSGVAVGSIQLNSGTINDSTGNSADLSFLVPDGVGILVDTSAPSISSVTLPIDGLYKYGQNLDFSFTLSESVIVNGVPRIPITVGSTSGFANYLSGTGTANIIFRYIIQATDLDANGITLGTSIDLNGGSAVDIANNSLGLSFTHNSTSGITVTPGFPTQFTVTGPTLISEGSCSTGFVLNFYDSANEVAFLSTSKNFQFGGHGSSVFYSDSNCTSVLSSLIVPSGVSSSQSFYMKSYTPNIYNLSFVSSGLSQTNAPFAVTIDPVLSWLGSTGVIGTLENGNYFASTKLDGGFNYLRSLNIVDINGSKFLFTPDYNNSSVQKFEITQINSINLIGALGRVMWHAGGKPTGGTNSSHCTNLGVGLGVTNGFCTGGMYYAGSGTNQDGMFNNPYSTTVLLESGSYYLYVSDYSNHRIVKYNAATGLFVGWTGRVSSVTGLGGASNCSTTPTGATTPGWCTGGSSQRSAYTTVSGSTIGGNTYGGNSFNGPTYITNDGTYIYVNDSGNNRLVRLNTSTGLLHSWMGRVASNTNGGLDGMTTLRGQDNSTSTDYPISCLTLNQSDGTTLVAGQFTPSWCSGGASFATVLPLSQFSNIYLNPQFSNPRGIQFYNDGIYNWMIISDNGFSRITRYFCGAATTPARCSDNLAVNIGTNNYYPGQFFGWVGNVSGVSTASGGSLPSDFSSFFQPTSTATSGVTNGWAYFGASGGATSAVAGGFSGPAGTVIYQDYLYITNMGNQRIDRMSLKSSNGVAPGRVNGWIGRVSTSPSAGVSGCAGATPGTVTPGWCTGGLAITGITVGSFYNPEDITTDGNYLFVADRDNNRISIHHISTGASVGAMGLRVNNLANGWSHSNYPSAPNAPVNSTANAAVVNRDSLIANGDQMTVSGNYMYVVDRSFHRIKKYRWNDGVFEGWIGLMSNSSPTGGDEACLGALVGGFTPGWCKGGGVGASSTFGFNGPRGIVSDGTYLYVSDQSNHRIVRIKESTGEFKGWIGLVSTAPSDGDAGCTSVTTGSATPGWCLGGTSMATNGTYPYVLGGFNSPQGLSGFIDSDSKFYLILADSGNQRLLKIDAAQPANRWWVGKNASGSSVCNAANGAMVMAWCAISGKTTSNSDTTNYLNNGKLSGTNLGIHVDGSGSTKYIYVTDANSSIGRVLRFDGTTGEFKGWIGAFSTVTTNASCEGGGTVAANSTTPGWCLGGSVKSSSIADGQFSNNLGGVYADGSSLFVSDAASFRISKFDLTNYGQFAGWKGKVLSNAGLGGGSGCAGLSVAAITPAWCTGGTSGWGTQIDFVAKSAAWDNPTGVWGIGSYLYIIDSGNGRIIKMPK